MRDESKPAYLEQLTARLSERTALIGIIGLGYVGLPLTLRYAEAGFRVLGIDIDGSKVERLNRGESYINHVPAADIARARSQGFEATTDFTRAGEPDALIICVPTPLNPYREPDLSFVLETTEALLPFMRPGQVLSLESTTYPGTTEEELKPRLESRSFVIGRDIFLVFSPEREDPGNPDFHTRTIPKVCGGVTPACLEAGIALYGAAIDRVVPVSSTRAAELTKLLENIHRAVNIGLVNEMKIIADRMKIDIHEVIRAAATKPFGFTPYYPGPGLGGHCIPIDPFYLTWKAREYGLHTRFIELAGEINSDMPHWVVSKLTDALNQRGKAVMGSRVLVLGIAYKKDVEDMRESPSVELMEILRDKGAVVDYADPHVPVFPRMREHHFDLKSVELTAQRIASYDVVLLATAHSAFDYDLVRQYASLIVDTRGVYLAALPNVVKA
ncbi:UDP-N-acetyl-D-glucosamine dehydrogenase [Massilia sp. Root133]|uniref:Nucleotide sugar dehydrogenase n=1 Tax=Massilia cellulosiltytica TaxID=2683234 RepID=A0A7X3FYS9_9BURK|nr:MULTISPECIES: nucleotide sugar dehydrogenase [Telluria group]KQY11987.1 UDP-N-acetyl-D-glucosamine dehydrogenase [Massilia sp. Root133]KQZ34534.1 UDP-N-acetyl-D-glucosamine dehydrogenase [Massilia sp. Root1485]MVW60549.1 nucleotide sugar dehydrogenase [Telluria cellulosilytica]